MSLSPEWSQSKKLQSCLLQHRVQRSLGMSQQTERMLLDVLHDFLCTSRRSGAKARVTCYCSRLLPFSSVWHANGMVTVKNTQDCHLPHRDRQTLGMSQQAKTHHHQHPGRKQHPRVPQVDPPIHDVEPPLDPSLSPGVLDGALPTWISKLLTLRRPFKTLCRSPFPSGVGAKHIVTHTIAGSCLF